MAIVQISKIIHRVGALTDLPQLDIGELGYSSDTQQLFIGSDPLIATPGVNGLYVTEILTDSSSIPFSKIDGSSNVIASLDTPEEGQLLGLANTANGMSIVNVGGNAGGEINLGNISNVKISGEAFNGAILQTDGNGNLSWTTNGTMQFLIANVSKANPAVVTTSTNHFISNGATVNFFNVTNNIGDGMFELYTGGVGSTNQYYVQRTGNTTLALYLSPVFSGNAVDSSGWSNALPNTGFITSYLDVTSANPSAGGANTQLQFNDSGSIGGASTFTFNKTTNNVAVNGNIIVTTGDLYGNSIGEHDGKVGNTTPATGAFTSVTATLTVAATGNITGGNISTAGIVSSANLNVSANATVSGRVTTANLTASANATVTGNLSAGNISTAGILTVTGNVSGGNVSTGGIITATGNVTGGNIVTANDVSANTVTLDTWSLFANVDGLFATDGANTYSINMTEV